jgi:hypothetical protein
MNGKKQDICPECGYTAAHLHGGTCPMCKPCTRCKRKIMQCACIEADS